MVDNFQDGIEYRTLSVQTSNYLSVLSNEGENEIKCLFFTNNRRNMNSYFFFCRSETEPRSEQVTPEMLKVPEKEVKEPRSLATSPQREQKEITRSLTTSPVTITGNRQVTVVDAGSNSQTVQVRNRHFYFFFMYPHFFLYEQFNMTAELGNKCSTYLGFLPIIVV